MITLKSVMEICYFVDYQDFDDWVCDYFGVKKYECAAHEEWENDSSHTAFVDGTFDRFDSQYIEPSISDFIAKDGNKQYMYQKLLRWACHKGDIPAGKYVIKVSW